MFRQDVSPSRSLTDSGYKRGEEQFCFPCFAMMPTYTLPDAGLSVLQVVEFHATKNPDHPLFRYDSSSSREGYEDITWSQAGKMFDKTAQMIRLRIGDAADCTPPLIVGILAATGTSPHPLSPLSKRPYLSSGAILYASLIFGTLRAGCTVFPLSTRNSDFALAHLIAESGVKYLLVSQDRHSCRKSPAKQTTYCIRKMSTSISSRSLHMRRSLPTSMRFSTPCSTLLEIDQPRTV